ncbi:hypothetical protein MMC07_009768 [Pseudocyphellaria aurata]|nr:hypothetical protein [Pseudocyphellaria aurata]
MSELAGSNGLVEAVVSLSKEIALLYKAVSSLEAKLQRVESEIPRRYWTPAVPQICWINDVFWAQTHTKKLMKKYRKRQRKVIASLAIARYENKKAANSEAGSRSFRLDQIIDLLRFQAQLACSQHGLPLTWPDELLERSARARCLIPTPGEMLAFVGPEEEQQAPDAFLDEPESLSTAAARGPSNAPAEVGVPAGHKDAVDELLEPQFLLEELESEGDADLEGEDTGEDESMADATDGEDAEGSDKGEDAEGSNDEEAENE